MKLYFYWIVLLGALVCTVTIPVSAQGVQLRYIRAYGAHEQLPPIIVRSPGDERSVQSDNNQTVFSLGSASVTIEVDIQADIIPNFFVQLVHCDMYWREDNNIFINDATRLRTSAISWQMAPSLARHYTHRGTLSVPNRDVVLPVSGNWKAKIFDNNGTTYIGEARFFVVDAITECTLDAVTDVYRPQARVGPAAYTFEASVTAPQNIIDDNLHTVVIYRNFRWFEPLIIAQQLSTIPSDYYHTMFYTTGVFGFATTKKRFRVEKIPCQNEYRALDLSNTTWFPNVGGSVRPPFADLRRNGVFAGRAQDGAFTSPSSAPGANDYIEMEFVLDPEAFPSPFDVFLVGSFNNWLLSDVWKMTFDAAQQQYTLTRWVRRGRHNYLYATGKRNAAGRAQEALHYEEFEGNNANAANTFIALYYYREMGFGGYDRIIGASMRNPASRVR